MKFLIALLVIVCLPLLKGQDFAIAHSQKQFFINHKSQRLTEAGTMFPQKPAYVQDLVIDDTDEDNNELKCQAKGYSWFNSMPGLHKSRLVDFASIINCNRKQQPAIPLSSKYIVAWALRI